MIKTHSGIWGPVLLVAIPLAVIGMLALKSITLEYSALDSQLSAAAMDTLRVANGALRTAALHMQDEAHQRVIEPASAGTFLIIREFVMHGGVDFVVIYNGENRFYPPEPTGMQLIVERERLRQLDPYLIKALAAPPNSSINVAKEDGTALMDCRPLKPERTACVLIGPQTLAAAFDGILTGLAPADSGWVISLVDPEGRTFPRDTTASTTPALVVLPMTEPMTGWRLEAHATAAAPQRTWRWLPPLAVVLSLTASWMGLGWTFARRHLAQLAEIKRRSEIAAQFSHELLTPLTNLGLYTDLLYRKADDSVAVRDYCAIMDAEIARLGRFTEDAITYSKGGIRQKTSRDTARPDTIIQGVIDRFAPLLDHANCTVRFHGHADDLVRLDVETLERITINLLDNACKYAPGGAVEITSRREGRKFTLVVRDFGPGIAPQLLDQIFEPLARGTHPGLPGFGLGLAVVSVLARAHGGCITAENAGPGARFRVTLTLDEVPSCTS